MALRIPAGEFVALLRSPAAVDDLGAGDVAAVVVHGRPTGAVEVPALLPVVVVFDGDHLEAPWCDVGAAGGDLERVIATTSAAPAASAALAALLRGVEERTVADGLLLESATYGTLQAGPEFGRWRQAHRARDREAPTGDAVRCERDGRRLEVSLARPDVRNALDAELRDSLAACLQVALHDPTLRVELRGDGPSFCSGGHLDEFGTRADPAAAHRIRLARNLGWLLHQLADRTEVHVHGACRGSGVELPAFAARVSADPDTTFGLPELGMGLIPGAGGTVSLPRRIGRHRTAWLALTGEAIDARTAEQWGLVDDVAPRAVD